MEEECSSLQLDEIAVLESIYPGLLELHENPSNLPGRLLTLNIPISLDNPVIATLIPSLSYSNPDTFTSPFGAGPSTHTFPALDLQHLPPISARILLPSTYPLDSPPKIISIKASLPRDGSRSSWLPRSSLRDVQNKLGLMWEEEKGASGEGTGQLWKWWEWVGLGEFLQELRTLNENQLKLMIPPTVSSSAFHTLLKTHNAAQLHSSFERTAFSCTICFENRKGKSCVQMPCGCVFCNPCLQACWTLAISEGTLESVSCPSPACVKLRATRNGQITNSDHQELDPALVESVVGLELKVRWMELKDRRKAEIDPTYCICPQPQCQAAVPPPPPPSSADFAAQQAISRRAVRLSDLSKSSAPPVPASPDTPSPKQNGDDRWARYRQCPKCQYSFCLYCSATWHGPHAPCSFPQTSALVLDYLSYPSESIERRRIEQRRGKQNMERMVAKYIEDEENKKWLDERTRACSGCGVRVEKSHGCNHMTCGRCGAHFCYRCGDSLRPTDPYAHYRKPGSCFERLFDQDEIERFERETAMQHAGMGAFDGLGGAGGGAMYGDVWAARNVWEAGW